MDVIAIDGTEIVSAVAIKLREHFTTSEIPNIYKDKPVQGMEKPCLFIQIVNDQSVRYTKNSFMRSYMIDVRFHPKDDDNMKDTTCSRISTSILDAVNTVNVSGLPVKAYEMNCRIEEEVLHCITTYRFKANEIEESLTKMKNLDLTEGVK